jgi:hypothetical protein
LRIRHQVAARSVAFPRGAELGQVLLSRLRSVESINGFTTKIRIPPFPSQITFCFFPPRSNNRKYGTLAGLQLATPVSVIRLLKWRAG